MPLSPGTRLGPYEILAPLGAGGMGEVYRARDPRIGREVAIKVLPAKFARDEDRLRRFEQEVRAAGALNHPNILTIFDVGDGGGSPYVVSELLEGETLRTRLEHGSIGPRRVLDYAEQIAQGLAAAHGKGICHRDLKPDNVFLTKDGRVKILDFGLARLLQPAETQPEAAATLTDPGLVMGTVGYMSPEQIRGKPADDRSDIFSFGVVLYEMISGKRAFLKDTAAETMTSILNDDPPEVPGSTPGMSPALERIMRRCLEKEPEQRFHLAHDLAFALEAVAGSMASQSAASAAIAPRAAKAPRQYMRLAVLCGAAVLLAAAGWWSGSRGATHGEPAWTIRDLTADEGFSGNASVSPDGKLVAYVSDRAGGGSLDLWVRQAAIGAPVRMTQGPYSVSNPSFSPDGSKIVFCTLEKPPGVYVVPALGGEARRVADVSLVAAPRFSPDGKWIAADILRNNEQAYMVIPTGGGEPVVVDPKLAKTTWRDSAPGGYVWAPDSSGLLVVGGQSYMGRSDRDLWFVSLDGKRKALQAGPRFAAAGFEGTALLDWQGEWLYLSVYRKGATDLWRMRLSPGSKAASAPERVTSGWGRVVTGIGTDAKQLVYQNSGSTRRHIWSLDLGPDGMAEGEPKRMNAGERWQENPVAAVPNRLFYAAEENGQFDLWLRDLTSGRESRLTDTADYKGYMVASHDGARLAFRAAHKGFIVYVMNAAGGSPHAVCNNCGRVTDWSPDNKRVIIHDFEGKQGVVGLMDPQTGEKHILMQSSKRIYSPSVSPDGHWLAFRAGASGEALDYIAPYHEDRAILESEWIPMDLEQSASYFQWASNGRLYYLAGEGDTYAIWTVTVDPATGKRTGTPSLVYRPQGTQLLSGDQAVIGLANAGGKIYFSMLDVHANVGMAEIEK